LARLYSIGHVCEDKRWGILFFCVWLTLSFAVDMNLAKIRGIDTSTSNTVTQFISCVPKIRNFIFSK
jgi:hypothetical protein